MGKAILKVLKNIILGFFILYGYNLIGVQFNCVIPINIITVLLVSILGTPALISLVFLYLVIFWGEVYGWESCSKTRTIY